MTNTVDSKLANKLNNSLGNILDFLQEAPRRLIKLAELISKCDKEVSDLTHKLEELEFEEVVFAHIALELKEVLNERRKYKNEKRVLESTYRKFKGVIGDAEIIEEAKEIVSFTIQDKKHKPYKPRIREDLFEC